MSNRLGENHFQCLCMSARVYNVASTRVRFCSVPHIRIFQLCYKCGNILLEVHSELVLVDEVLLETIRSISNATGRKYNTFVLCGLRPLLVDVLGFAWRFRSGCEAVCPACFAGAVQDIPAAEMCV